jgi:hypothetical protein
MEFKRGIFGFALMAGLLPGLPQQIRADGPTSNAAPATIHALKAQGIENF